MFPQSGTSRFDAAHDEQEKMTKNAFCVPHNSISTYFLFNELQLVFSLNQNPFKEQLMSVNIETFNNRNVAFIRIDILLGISEFSDHLSFKLVRFFECKSFIDKIFSFSSRRSFLDSIEVSYLYSVC